MLKLSALTLVVLSSLTSFNLAAEGDGEAKTKVGVPGLYVRQATTQEGVVVMGYRAANMAIGRNWMSLDIAMTVYEGFNTTFSRDDVALKLPDGRVVPLAGREEFLENRSLINSLNKRASVQGDSVAYLPAKAATACLIGFFPDPLDQTSIMIRDEVDLTPTLGCYGRFYFQLDEGIQLGQHFMLVRLVDEDVVVPFTIMTKEEAKVAEKKLKQARKDEKKKRKAEKKAMKENG
jgi:hypothetical protein